MQDYYVEAKSRKDLRLLAKEFRKLLGIDKCIRVPIVELLDVLSEYFVDFSYEIVLDNAFPEDIHADIDVVTKHIRIKESVYDNACSGNGRDRMTIAHEIAHYFMLCICGFKLQRNVSERSIPRYMDPEWQAKCFAGEFMIDSDLVGEMYPCQIEYECGVSKQAANFQYRFIHGRRWRY